jgi:hypothetical protein
VPKQDLKESRGNAVKILAQCGEGGSKQTDWPGIHSLERNRRDGSKGDGQM